MIKCWNSPEMNEVKWPGKFTLIIFFIFNPLSSRIFVCQGTVKLVLWIRQEKLYKRSGRTMTRCWILVNRWRETSKKSEVAIASLSSLLRFLIVMTLQHCCTLFAELQLEPYWAIRKNVWNTSCANCAFHPCCLRHLTCSKYLFLLSSPCSPSGC